MCQRCVEAIQRHYPHLTEQEGGELLMGATCWPMGTPEMVEKQLIELKEKTDGTLVGALAYADKELMAWGKRMERKEEL